MKRAGYAGIIAGVVVLALVAAASALLPVAEWADALEDRVESLSLFEGIVLFGAVYVVATLLLLPAWIFALVAGAAFGLGWGLFATLASSTASAMIAFLIARYLLRARIEKIARKHEALKAVDSAVGRDAWKVVALLRLSPVLPSNAKSYFLGVTRVKLIDYATATLAGTFPGILLKVYIGATGREALAHGSPLSWSLLAVGVVATLGVTFLVGRVAQRRFKRAESG